MILVMLAVCPDAFAAGRPSETKGCLKACYRSAQIKNPLAGRGFTTIFSYNLAAH